MSQYDKILIGQSIPLMEVDDEESELNEVMIKNAEISADFSALEKEFNTENFKILYLNLYNEIHNEIEIDKQKELCEKLLKKLNDIYNFEFTPLLTFDNFEDIESFLKFVEFLEFDYIDFLSEIIYGLDFSLLKKDIEKFMTFNWNTIFNKAFYNYKNDNELIIKFIRTNNKDELYNFIYNRLLRDKMLVILKTIEREF